MQTQYRTSRQSRVALEHIRGRAERPSLPRRAAVRPAYGPAWPVWQVVGELVGGAAVTLLVAATSADMAVDLARPRLRDGATATLVARPAAATMTPHGRAS